MPSASKQEQNYYIFIQEFLFNIYIYEDEIIRFFRDSWIWEIRLFE